ncbi:MAG: phosphoribosylanthranilate isomerase [Thermoguttaceae bacterium]
MFRIKICGITSVEDARVVVRAGADAVGLNFYPGSPRFVTLETVRKIVDALPDGVVKVGLFVNAEADHLTSIADLLGLGLVQLHGDEPPEFLVAMGDRPVMRAFRLGQDGLQPITEYLRRCRRLDCMPRMALIDSHVAGAYGGTGAVADWPALARYPADEDFPPLVLAGGLTPLNVAESINTVGPAAVDTASGVESGPGRKDPAAVEAFVRAAQRAFGDV